MSGNSPGGHMCEGAMLQCALMKVLLRLIVVGTLITLAGCGGGGPNPVTPSALTVADVAPSLGQTINSTFAAAMKAGMSIASLQTTQPETVFASLFRLLISQPASLLRPLLPRPSMRRPSAGLLRAEAVETSRSAVAPLRAAGASVSRMRGLPILAAAILFRPTIGLSPTPAR